MAASKSSLLLLNFVIERRWFDLLIAEFAQVLNWFILYFQWGCLCSSTLGPQPLSSALDPGPSAPIILQEQIYK